MKLEYHEIESRNGATIDIDPPYYLEQILEVVRMGPDTLWRVVLAVDERTEEQRRAA